MQEHKQIQLYVGLEEGGCVDVGAIKLDGFTLIATSELEALKASVKEEAHDAYWQASDNNRCDRWSDTFDEDIREEFEKYWQENHKAGA